MMAGIFSIFSEDVDEALENDAFISSFFDNQLDFVQIIPEKVSNKIFLLLSAKDVLACCCVSSAWRNVINNDLHWIIRCTNIGWKPESEDPLEWPQLESHVRVGAKLQRTSPEWSLSTLASLTIKPCCSWGKRFREFLHLRWIWRNGNFVKIKLTSSEALNSNESCSAVACHGKYLAIGTTRGMLYVWNVNGTPKLCQTVSPIRQDIEVEQIRMNKDYLALIHQYGLVRVYQFIEPTADTVLGIITENRVWGLAVSIHEYSLFHQEMKDGQVQPTSTGPDEPMTELEMMIRDLLLEDPCFDTEYDSKQMSFNLTDSHFIISGYSSNCFLLWCLATKSFVKKVMLPQGVRAGRLSFANSEILYLTGKRRRPGPLLTGSIFIYQLVDPFEFIEIPAGKTSEKIRIHPSDNDRLVWFSVDADVTAINDSGQDNPDFENDVSQPTTKKNSTVSTVSKKEVEGIPPPAYDTAVVDAKVADPELGPAGPQRQVWDSQIEFLLSCISMSVGLGNVWRFPVTAYNNGGGAFLIPYLIVLVFVGRPIYFLELAVGQFCSQSQVKIWKCNPLFKGVGYASMIATICVMSYYCSILALTVFYCFASFAKTLPWEKCDESWVERNLIPSCNASDLKAVNKTLPELYFVHEVLQEASDIDSGIGAPEWRMTLCLLFSWLVIYLSLIKGVKSSGKVAYFTALFPYIVLIPLLIRGVTLKGAWTGIEYFIKPQWYKLYDPEVWYAAVGQCFFSLNTGFGSVIMFASYNPFKHNIYRDAVILSFMDTFTSLLAGITVFSVLGYLSVESGTPVPDLLGSGGKGIAFISYPAALAQFPVSQLFSVLFFLMLFTLGIGSATADAGAIITLFADNFPNVKRWYITTGLCGAAFLVGLIYVTPGGQFILTLVDTFGSNFVIFLTSVLEVVGIAWFYGLNNFIKDIEFMLGIKVGWYWKICWGGLIPVGLTIILVYSLVIQDALSYNDVSYPTSALACGWVLAVVALSPLPICAFLAIRKSTSLSFVGKLKDSWQPVKGWGPMDPRIREEWVAFKEVN